METMDGIQNKVRGIRRGVARRPIVLSFNTIGRKGQGQCQINTNINPLQKSKLLLIQRQLGIRHERSIVTMIFWNNC
jgi:hypothetical protein